MRFSQLELELLEQLAAPQRVRELSRVLDKSLPQFYRVARSLEMKGLLKRSRGVLSPTKGALPSLFIRVLNARPQLKPFLADSGIPLLLALPGTADELAKIIDIKRSMIYKKLEEATNMSIVKKEDGRYVFNSRLWNDLELLLGEIKTYEATTDPRVPVGSIIYEKSDKEIIFSTSATPEAVLTAFSAYGQHGIKLLLPVQYYYLPKKALSVEEVFFHSLHVAAQEQSTRLFLYIALFYLKHQEQLQAIHHPILTDIKKVLRGEKVAKYPTRAEIAERAELYDIRLSVNT